MSEKLLPKVNFVSRDLVQLKLEKKMLEASLKINQGKMDKVGGIMNRKLVRKGQDKVDPATTLNARGKPLSDYIVPRNKIRVPVEELSITVAKARKGVDINTIDPSPVRKGSNLERIRMSHTLRTAGKKILESKQRLEDDKAAKAVAKAKRGKRTAFPKCTVPASMFPNRYIRGELPCTIEHGLKGWYLSWVCPLDKLDYDFYMTIFFDGLQCGENPYSFLAQQGIEDLLYAAKGDSARITPLIPSLIRPMRNALSKFDVPILLATLKCISQLLESAPGVGETLMPYAKQFLAPLAVFLDMNKNLGDGIDYSQRKNNDVGEQVRKTLELLEERGGPGAYKSIKFSIPLYESCLKDQPHE